MIDEHQRKIVELQNGSALLLAGPGCGKTHILARRVFHANTVCDILFADMLCLTFTNRAAREMASRVHSYLGEKPAGLFIGNIHRFCLRFLHVNGIISPDTSVFDAEDLQEYICSTFGIDNATSAKVFSDKMAYIYQRENDHPDRVVRRLAIPPTDRDYEIYEQFTAFKEENRLIDFDSILLMTYTALLSPKSKDYAMTGYRWIQVDEVQDMTPIQLEIVRRVSTRGAGCALYLGDEQQAIFSFLGAGGRALDSVKKLCSGHILRLQRNYRSPDYLVRLCNTIAAQWLGIAPCFLPYTDSRPAIADSLIAWKAHPSRLPAIAAAQARRLLAENPGEDVAILVRTNKDGEIMAELLQSHGFKFFHVSQQDIFHQAAFKTVWSHLAVILQPTRSHEWARLLYQLRAVRTLGGARSLVSVLRSAAMCGADLLSLDSPTAIERLAAAYGSPDATIAVIDTETTGLDIFMDDVIQIAAIKIRGGRKVEGSEFSIFVRTDRHIPRFLSNGVDNPIKAVYGDAEKHDPEKALASFAEYLADADYVAGHNIGFDTAILRNNYTRRSSCPMPRLLGHDAQPVDTLLIARLLHPKLWSHRLGFLLDTLGIEGINSHNACDDVEATANLLSHLAAEGNKMLKRQQAVRSNTNVRRAATRIEAAYSDIYKESVDALYNDSGSIASEIDRVSNIFTERGYINGIRHKNYMLKLINEHIVDSMRERNLREQLQEHLTDLLTYSESDLFANGIVKERLSIMTIHKAKGLEMDNVIVLDSSATFGKHDDYARVLYVAYSRAKKRLYTGLGPDCGKSGVTASVMPCFRILSDKETALLEACEAVHAI